MMNLMAASIGRSSPAPIGLEENLPDSPGKKLHDEPSGNIAVQSASALSGPNVGSLGTDSQFDETADQFPGPRAGAATSTVAGAPPAAFGRYRVKNALGAGGFGAVYLGHDDQLERPVAIKVHRGGTQVPQAEAEQFLQEARRLAQLRHPGIVTVHDVGLHEGQVYIVSDYLEGPNLADWLKQNSPSWRDAALIAAAVADALSHAHARLIVHRDVKPANIIITRDRTPVLVDFGLGLDEAVADGREKNVVSGTPLYMSPEQVAGTAHRIDGRTDIYSLGVVLYEMFCGRVPFRANNIKELLRQVRQDEPQPPRQLADDIPPELERACLKALAKRQQDRYTTAADFALDLRHLSVSTIGPATPPSSRSLADALSGGGTHATGQAFSHSAGVTSSSRSRARQAERRQVTVLVCGCDAFESGAYLENLDAEDQATVLQDFQQSCEQAVRRFDGTLVQCNEQGVLVCFGYPVAYEDAARRAAQSGLAILQNMKVLGEKLRREQELELNPWVGIHTGPAVAEMGENAISLVGEARNLALRLADVVEPGQVICSAATHLLIRRYFECVSLGRRKFKGVAQPVEIFRVDGAGEVHNSLERAGPAGLTPLTGRDHEISVLKDRWEQAQEGVGQVVLLNGEAGMGKSRLVYALKQHVQGQTSEVPGGQFSSTHAPATHGSPVVEWRCSPHFQNTGLYSLGDFFERFLSFEHDDAPDARFDRLVRHLSEYDLATLDTVPLFASLLGLPLDDRFPPLGLSPIREREETFRAVRAWLGAYSDRRPVLFIIEDLHWVDASTLEFLGQLVSEGLHERMLTLLTYRPEFQTPWPAVAQQTSLALNRLTRRQVGDVMRMTVGSDLPEALVEQVYDRTGGVPLFVEEFTKMVQESAMLDRAGAGGVASHALPAREIPATLQDLVMARLDRLEGDRELAQLAAALGREFSYELLAAVATLGETALQAELAKLLRAEILYQKGRLPRCSYVFRHALLEDALYNSLVKSKRQQFHGRIADVLEARLMQSAATQPELLAHHFTEAGLTDRAVHYWLKAALRSRERSAEIEAISHLTRAQVVLLTLAESPERDARELELLIPLGTAYIASRGYAAPEVGPVFRRARELCERVGQPPQLFALMLGTWEWHTVRGDLRLCTELAAEGMELAARLEDPGMLMEALFMAGETMLYRGDFADARDCFASAVADYDDRERTKLWAAHTSHNAGITHRANLAVSLWHLGYPDQAVEANRQMLDLARAIGHSYSLAYALHHTAWLWQHCRIGAEALAAAEQEIAIATEQGFALWHATGTFFKGAAILLQGDPNKALPLLLKGHRAFRTGGAELTLPFQFSVLADAYAQSGRFDDARQALFEGLAIAEKNDERCQEAELQRQRGELLLAESPDYANAADECFRQAIETARRQRNKAWELRATMSLARLMQQQGRRSEAHHMLAAVHGRYTEGWTTSDLVEAAALLEALEGSK
jgi:class 3 adenylate cyclase/tetratricopeptide (TPR) repeat protein